MEGKEQTLVEHLKDLRQCLIKAALIIIVGAAGCVFISDKIFDIIRRPVAPFLTGGGLVFTAPMDLFMAHLEVSLLAGTIITSPLWLYQVWKFVMPGLLHNERRAALAFIASGTFLFAVGIAFAYFVVYPVAFEYLMTYGGGTDKPMISVHEYLSFFITTTLMFGAAFEMPLILAILGLMGVVTHKDLSSKRRYAIVVLSVVAALMTPPDILSMAFMLVPLLFLYEISILIVRYLEPKSAR